MTQERVGKPQSLRVREGGKGLLYFLEDQTEDFKFVKKQK